MSNSIREALSDATSVLEDILDAFSRGEGGVYKSDVAEAIDNARAALAKPPRNCDRFDTVDEARKAHEEYCRKYIMRASNKFDFPMEFDAWLFAPAKEQEGENDEQK